MYFLLIAIIALPVCHRVGAAVTTLGCDPMSHNETQCPPHSSCQPACPSLHDAHVCLCNRRNLFFKDLAATTFRCFTVVKIGKACDDVITLSSGETRAATRRCPSRASWCEAGVCRCRTPFLPTLDGYHCKPGPIVTAASDVDRVSSAGRQITGPDGYIITALHSPKRRTTTFSGLDEPCDTTEMSGNNDNLERGVSRRVCVNADELVCSANDGKCRCRPGTRPASIAELIKHHNVGFYCRPLDSSRLRDFYLS